MVEQNKSRRQKLEQFLKENPNDAFSRYGIALECLRERDVAGAEDHFRKLIKSNPQYVPGYQMFGQMLIESGRAEEAMAILNQGIEAAERAGNQHARSEMQGLLDQLN